jgi:hypothetical protein
MTLIIGVIASLILEAVKRVKARYGDELGSKLIYGSIFLIALVWTILTTTQIISPETVNKILTIIASAVATYEIILKRLPIDQLFSGSDKK